jgi:hypothetical protein
MKIGYFIKEKKKKSKWKRHTSSTQRKNLKKHRSHKNKLEKNKLARHKLALKHDIFDSKNCLIIRQLDDHRSQRNLEPLNFTFQATDRSKRSLFLGTIVRKGIITSIYRDTSLKVSVLIPKSAR